MIRIVFDGGMLMRRDFIHLLRAGTCCCAVTGYICDGYAANDGNGVGRSGVLCRLATAHSVPGLIFAGSLEEFGMRCRALRCITVKNSRFLCESVASIFCPGPVRLCSPSVLQTVPLGMAVHGCCCDGRGGKGGGESGQGLKGRGVWHVMCEVEGQEKRRRGRDHPCRWGD